MIDKLKSPEYNLIDISKRIGQLNFQQVNYQIEERLKKIIDLVYDMYNELETIEIIVEDNQLETSNNIERGENAV